ncbi:uncharacterized protein [Dermacentor albipictus]|uniref:uncharacterized protein isoform X2 n=1 Tax=Dermacentor albipictus TaxID=60249 RepID=UPI0038FC55DF
MNVDASVLFTRSAEPSSAAVDVTWMSQLDRQAAVPSATDSRHIKPTLHSATFSRSGSTAAAMVHNHARLVLQILSVIVSSAEPSSAAVDVTWMSQLDRQAAVPSATDSRHIKPTLHSATFSGGGSMAVAMVHNHAWLDLQILPLIVSSAEPSSATVDDTWMSQLDRQAVVTSATNRWPIKPTLPSATLSGGCSTAMAMVHNHAWLVLQCGAQFSSGGRHLDEPIGSSSSRAISNGQPAYKANTALGYLQWGREHGSSNGA